MTAGILLASLLCAAARAQLDAARVPDVGLSGPVAAAPTPPVQKPPQLSGEMWRSAWAGFRQYQVKEWRDYRQGNYPPDIRRPTPKAFRQYLKEQRKVWLASHPFPRKPFQNAFYPAFRKQQAQELREFHAQLR